VPVGRADGEPLLDALLPPAWRGVLGEVLAGPAGRALEAFLAGERAAGREVLPPREQVFAALDLVEPEDVRVVILGQDPYPTPGHAHGLAFSYQGDGPPPRSLRNIFAEIEDDLGYAPSSGGGDLTPWARQGVLLLNTALTVRAGEAGSHRRRGWAAVTDRVLRHLAVGESRVVFVLWGGAARRKHPLLGERHPVLEAGHPSPLSVRYFRGCRHFRRIAELVEDPPIDWRLQ
jgi:uracil-DNA glycosylase